MDINTKNKVTKYLSDNLKIMPGNIKCIKKILLGFTNEIFYVILNDNTELKVRFANHNKYINRELEKIIEFDLYKEEILFYEDNGNFIKKWIIGETLTVKDLNDIFWKSIIQFNNQLCLIKINKIFIAKPVYFLENHKLEESFVKPFHKYKKILDELIINNNNKICHNDLSCNNIIIKDNQFSVIDFEWSSYNHELWDICNLIKDLELNYEDVITNKILMLEYDKNILFKIIYAVHFYTYYWTYKIEENKKIINYRLCIIKKIFYWYEILIEKNII